ncbi:SDR family oxidoreductase [Jidongwangia harbinensis]|uniref:SDR family oxidoreductase n=1 Tax=Jidongwangia harbinensis TaxID=2878561 RepID=UPI001CDA38C9|nr:NmrA family NAD(P)-binding protein [Jidongwangia harbinensis]MCA2217642.1 NmrA family NAD(P)-binding protein [Jidongwangia harbinensis]
MSAEPTILVTGATGTVGRLVVAGLLDRGARVRAFVRSPQKARLPPAVDLVEGDMSRPDTIAKAAAGADAAFLLWPGYSAGGAAQVIDALANHVPHVVYLSAARLQRGESGPMPGVWAEVEAILQNAPVTSTFVRGGGFATNTLEWAEQIRNGAVVDMPYPDAARSLVHEHDLADMVVQALLDSTHAGRAYVATGPEVLTQQDQVRIIGEVLGRTLRVQRQSPEQARAELTESAGEFFAEQALAYWASLVREPERVSSDVQDITGHPARSYAQWVHDHADNFAAPS